MKRWTRLSASSTRARCCWTRRRTLPLAIEFPSFVPESMNLLQLLKSLQRQQRGLAIVLDEFGGTAGIVTIEDILAEVLGEIRSEHAHRTRPCWKSWPRTAGASAARCAWTISAANTRRCRDVPGVRNHGRPGPARI